MCRSIAVSLILVVLLALTDTGRAGNDAAAILDKAAKAHMPKGKSEGKKAYRGKNKGTLFIQGLELEFTQDIALQTSGKFKEVMEMSIMGQAIKTMTVFNGKEGWLKVNAMEIPVKDEMLAEFKEIAHMMALGQLTGLKDMGLKFSLIGEVQVNGKPAVGVKISKEGKKDLDFYFDAKTNLLAKTERRTLDFQSGMELTEERIVVQYHDVGGRPMPKRVTVNRDGKKMMDVEIVEAHTLDQIDDSEFVRP